MLTEEFNFPKVTANTIYPHFTISPSLWHVSSLIYPDYIPDEDNGREEGFSRKSFSYLESKIGREMDAAASRESEEKMDRLWEGFNEELQRVPSMDKRKEADQKLSKRDVSNLESEGGATKEIMGEFCSLQALKMSKTSKRPKMFVVIKVLKKLFLLRNSLQIKKNY